MSKYQKYANELDEAFNSAATVYGDAWKKYQAAKVAKDNAPSVLDDKNEYKIGENEATRARLNAELIEAESEFKQIEKTVWRDFENTMANISREFHDALKADGILKADSLDVKAMTLLNSGVMNADDLRSMAKEYAGNATMLRMIAKTATEASEAVKTDDERRDLTMLVHDIGNGQSAIENSWDALCNTCNTYSGQNHSIESRHGDYVTAMNAHWYDKAVRDMIDNF